ncbi:MAG: hypothetical protein PHC62_00255 [Candidatus Izemoplasmatales bacterium]|nr:hypothetical protein [Candidatus Izemoplasmatales bacterium]
MYEILDKLTEITEKLEHYIVHFFDSENPQTRENLCDSIRECFEERKRINQRANQLNLCAVSDYQSLNRRYEIAEKNMRIRLIIAANVD